MNETMQHLLATLAVTIVRTESTVRQLLTDNVGSALSVSSRLGANGTEIASVARTAFVDSMSSSLWVAVGLAVAATAISMTQLPRHKRHGHAEARVAGTPIVKDIAIPAEANAERHHALHRDFSRDF